VVVAVNGVQAPASGRARRVLRRTVLVAGFAGAGWLLAAAFGGSASAAPVSHVDDEVLVADREVPEAPARADMPGRPTTEPSAHLAGQVDQEPAEQANQLPVPSAGPPAQTPAQHSPAGGAAQAPAARTEVGQQAQQPVGGPGQALAQPSLPAGPPAQAVVRPVTPPNPSPAQLPEPIDLDEALTPLSTLADQPAPTIPISLPVTPTENLLAGLLNGLTGFTDSVTTLSQSITDVLDPASETPAAPAAEPITALPEPPPGVDASPEASNQSAAEKPAARTEPVPLAAPAPAPTVRTAPKQPAPAVSHAVAAPAAPERAEHTEDPERTEESPRPLPGNVPTPSPAGGPTTATHGHDSSSGARDTHGILTPQAPLEPPSTGFTSRSRASGVSGRIAGLPATSPD
jgi:hypothetical protein